MISDRNLLLFIASILFLIGMGMNQHFADGLIILSLIIGLVIMGIVTINYLTSKK